MLNKDQVLLEKCYEQILLAEKSSLTTYGFSKLFMKSVHDTFTVPHDANLIQLSKLPTKDEFESKYSFIVLKTKGNDEIFIRLYGMDVDAYELNSQTNKFESICADYGKLKGAANKQTIFAGASDIKIEVKEYLRRTKYEKLAKETFDLMLSKFGEKFIKEIESIKDFIYDNIRHFKLLKDEEGDREIEKVVNLLNVLESLKIKDSHITEKAYYNLIKSIAGYRNHFNVDFEKFVKGFEQNPSYTNLANLYLQLIKEIKNDVLVIYYSDELGQFPPKERKEKLKELLKVKALEDKLPEIEGIF